MTETASISRPRGTRETRGATPRALGDGAAARRRLIRLKLDLHDGPMQDLVVVGQLLAEVERELTRLAGDRSNALSLLESAKRQLGELERSLRSMVSEHSGLESRTMLDVMQDEISRFEPGSRAVVKLDIAGDVELETDSQRIAMQRVLREALTNIARHADATEVRIELFEADGLVYLRVRDNGRGVGRAAVRKRADGRSPLGLAGMRERLELLDGSLVFASKPGGPTTVTASLKRWRPTAQAGSGRKAADGASAPPGSQAEMNRNWDDE